MLHPNPPPPPHSEDTPLLPSKSSSNLPALKALLQPPGLNVLLYTSKGPKAVTVTLTANQLKWETRGYLSTKSYQLDLTQALFVLPGKKSKNLKAKAVVPDELCLSVVTHDSSLDISVGKKSERDILVLGLGEMLGGRGRV